MYRNYTCRIYPTKEQEKYLELCCDASRMVFNMLVEAYLETQKCDRSFGDEQYARLIAKGEVKDNGKRPYGAMRLGKYGRNYKVSRPSHLPLTDLAKTNLTGGWMSHLSISEERHPGKTLADVPSRAWMKEERQFRILLRNVYNGSSGCVKFRSKDRNYSVRVINESAVDFIIQGDKICLAIGRKSNLRDRLVRSAGLQKLPPRTRIAEVIYKRDSCRQWHCTLSCAIPDEFAANSPPSKSIGLDRGVVDAIATSEGELLRHPDLSRLDSFIKKQRRSLSRQEKDSNRYGVTRLHLARLYKRRASIIKDWNHKASTKIARENSQIAIEDLKIKNMTRSAKGTIENPGTNVVRKSGLNRAILAQNWGQFARMLEYKVEERQGELVKVDPKYTSQICSECGSKDTVREGKSFSCNNCGLKADADINAAKNILHRGFPDETALALGAAGRGEMCKSESDSAVLCETSTFGESMKTLTTTSHNNY